MHRFLSRRGENAGLTRRGRAPACGSAPANVLYGTLRRPTECNAGRTDDFAAAVENLCIIRVRTVVAGGHIGASTQEPSLLLLLLVVRCEFSLFHQFVKITGMQKRFQSADEDA